MALRLERSNNSQLSYHDKQYGSAHPSIDYSVGADVVSYLPKQSVTTKDPRIG